MTFLIFTILQKLELFLYFHQISMNVIYQLILVNNTALTMMVALVVNVIMAIL